MIIAFEGIDASGKQTQTSLLTEKVRSLGLDVAILSFPRYGETQFAKLIAAYLNGGFGDLASLDPHFPALLFAGDRFESRGTIEQLSRNNDVLILDRYVASNLAYQSARIAHNERQSFITWLAHLEFEIYGLPHPDLTVYLDIPAEIATMMVYKKKQRSYLDGAADIHEKNAKYMANAREVYLQLADMNFGSTWVSVACLDTQNAMRDPLEINGTIWQAVDRRITATCRLPL